MIAGLLGMLTTSSLFRKAVVVGGIILAVLLALAGFRRKAEKAGRLIEREERRVEVAKANARVEEVRKKMDEVPRPSRPDVVDKLRSGKF